MTIGRCALQDAVTGLSVLLTVLLEGSTRVTVGSVAGQKRKAAKFLF